MDKQFSLEDKLTTKLFSWRMEVPSSLSCVWHYKEGSHGYFGFFLCVQQEFRCLLLLSQPKQLAFVPKGNPWVFPQRESHSHLNICSLGAQIIFYPQNATFSGPKFFTNISAGDSVPPARCPTFTALLRSRSFSSNCLCSLFSSLFRFNNFRFSSSLTAEQQD